MTLPRNERVSLPPLGAKLFAESKISENQRTKRRSRRGINEGKDGTMGQHQAKFIAARDAQIQKLKDPSRRTNGTAKSTWHQEWSVITPLHAACARVERERCSPPLSPFHVEIAQGELAISILVFSLPSPWPPPLDS